MMLIEIPTPDFPQLRAQITTEDWRGKQQGGVKYTELVKMLQVETPRKPHSIPSE